MTSLSIKKENVLMKMSSNELEFGEVSIKNSDGQNPEVINKMDLELLFPTQLKSYYASAEF